MARGSGLKEVAGWEEQSIDQQDCGVTTTTPTHITAEQIREAAKNWDTARVWK